MARDLRHRHALEHLHLDHAPQLRIDGCQPLHQVLHQQQILAVRLAGVGKNVGWHFVDSAVQRPRMVNQQAFHNLGGQTQECRPPAFVQISGVQPFDFDQFQVELIHQHGGLPGVVCPLALHARSRESPQLGIENLHQLASRVVATGPVLSH